jgi:hypothetical protein
MSFSIRHNRVPSALGPDHLLTGTVPVANLGTGTANATTFLRGDGAWAAPAGLDILGRVRCRRTTDQAIPNTTLTLITWNADDYDTGGYHNPSVNPSRITAPAGAVTVELSAYAAFEFVGTTGVRALYILRNSAGVLTPANTISEAGAPNTAGVGIYTATGRFPCVGGDYFELWTNQTNGAARNMRGPAGTRGAPSFFEAVFYSA